MNLILDQMKPEYPELFAHEFGKIAETDFVYTLASSEHPELFALEFGKIAETVYTLASPYIIYKY